MLGVVHVFAGLGWDPAIRGILVVTLGVAILMGSTYLLLATNTGARLGLLIALAALFGWLSILTGYWWITPPGIGPSGAAPSWRPLEIYVHESDGSQGPAKTEVLNLLPDPATIPSAAKIIAEHPELEKELVAKPENTTLSDLAGIKTGEANYLGPNILAKYQLATTQPNTGDPFQSALNGWKIITTSQAGEASATADAALADSKLFKDATEYKKVGAYEFGGDQTRQEACPAGEGDRSHDLLPPDALCRVLFRLKSTFGVFNHPPRYQVIQVQQVVPQETQPGQPPPIPKVDQTKPVISIVLIRDQGNLRAKPAYFFVICFSLFLVFVLMLHYRDKTLQKHLEEAEALKTGKAVARVEN